MKIKSKTSSKCIIDDEKDNYNHKGKNNNILTRLVFMIYI